MSCAAPSPSRRLCTGLIALALGASLAQAQAPHAGAASSKPQVAASQPRVVPPRPHVPKPSKTRASYNIGLSFGQALRGASLTPSTISLRQLERGLRDAMAGKRFQREDQQVIQAYVMEVRQKIGKRNIARAKAFLAVNAKKPGIVTTPSGLQYKVITPGSGEPPKRTDIVSVLYTGKLLNGTEFDGTDKRGNRPASFPLGTMIPGWQEALSLMKPGAKWEIFIPPNLGYNMNSRGPIPPGSLLVFNVQLLKVTKSRPPPAFRPHPLLPPPPAHR